jgi:sulfatase modifying factor 1
MPVVFTKDTLRASVEAASGGKQTVLYDDKGYPSYMTIIPKFNIEDIDASLGSGVHPAFIVGGVTKSQIFIGTHQAIIADGRACSIPGQAAKTSVNFDTAKAACVAKGSGWHLMTAWEWAAIALWCLKNGFQPRGNTNWRRSHELTYEVGVATDGGTPGSVTGEGRTLAGSGPASWRHDNTYQGISDLVGNVWEWNDGLKMIDGRFYFPVDNNFSQAESAWPASSAYIDASAGPGDRNGIANSGDPILSASVSKYTETPTPAGGTDPGDFDTADIGTESGWRSMALSASYDGLSLAIRQQMAQLLIAPKLTSAGSALFSTAKGGIWTRNYGERFPIRGGSWYYGASAGLGALSLNNRRSNVSSDLGLRPAFIL